MTFASPQQALRQYRDAGIQAAVEFATPHQLIQMLYDGALGSLAAAKGHAQRSEIAAKGAAVGKTLSIVLALRSWLNPQAGGEIAYNLARLYDYVEQRLLEANTKNDPRLFDEIAHLLGEIKSGWEAIAAEAPVVGGR
jgi:flagellar protein FliS